MDLIELCKSSGYAESDLNKFILAVKTAAPLSHIQRHLGDSFFDHNLRVAQILAENKAAPEVIITALIQSCGLENKVIEELFGKETVLLVNQVNELRQLTFRNKKLQAEAFRKIILTTIKDVRAIFVKLAAKIDNLRTITVFPVDEQQRMAREVLEIYAPLAYRLGVDRMKSQLEDLAFKIFNPKKFQEIYDFLEQSSEERDRQVNEAITLINHISHGKISILSIKGRPKSIYSIYRKIVEKKHNLRDLFDLLGIRVIVSEIKDCYLMLGLLHETFEPIEGRLKDYIANPKSNSYQSIHTSIKLPNQKIVEVQIRTPEMDELAEEGLAAHWQYKGLKSDLAFEKKLGWLQDVLKLQKENPEFLETLKVDVFGDNIYCYTPNGDVRELPVGACALDFAYFIHEEIGSHAVGARVNGLFVPLKHQLRAGDVVEIVTNKNQHPRRSWIKLVRSPRARQKIRKSLKLYEQLPSFRYQQLKPWVKNEGGVLIESEDFPRASCILAKCCLALPGEEIVGIVTKRKVISAHRADCRAAVKEQQRWVPINWKSSFNQQINFYVRAEGRGGILADLVHTIAAAGFEVKEAKAKFVNSQTAECSFRIIPSALERLKDLVTRIKKVNGVKTIYFE